MMAFYTYQEAWNFAESSIRGGFWQRARIWKTGDLWVANSALYAIADKPWQHVQKWYEDLTP